MTQIGANDVPSAAEVASRYKDLVRREQAEAPSDRTRRETDDLGQGTRIDSDGLRPLVLPFLDQALAAREKLAAEVCQAQERWESMGVLSKGVKG